MRLPEQRLWDRMRKALGGKLRLERVENLVSVGDPDVTSTAPGNWVTRVELKWAPLPKRRSTAVLGRDGLSLAQRNWHLEHKRFGISYVLVGVESAIFTIDGALHDEINSFTIDELREHSMANNWEELHTLLDPSWKRKA